MGWAKITPSSPKIARKIRMTGRKIKPWRLTASISEARALPMAWKEKLNTNIMPMTGVEMRSSAPCRILRDRESFVSVSTPGLYPVGEGAGYAGGIMSAAVDGLKAALAFLKKMGKI